MILEILAFGAGALIGGTAPILIMDAIESERADESSHHDWYENVHMEEMRRIAARDPNDPPSSCLIDYSRD